MWQLRLVRGAIYKELGCPLSLCDKGMKVTKRRKKRENNDETA